MNKSKGEIKWWPWIIVFAIIPFVVSVLMMFENPLNIYLGEINETHWLSFLGGYIGACITGVVTLYVLRITYNQNNKNIKDTLSQNQTNHSENQAQNNKLIQLQINTTKYNRAMQELDIIRNVLDENYKVIDYQRFSIAARYILNGDVETASELLLSINRDVEMAGNKSDLYINNLAIPDALSIHHKNYLIEFKRNQLSFGALVNDFIFFTQFRLFVSKHIRGITAEMVLDFVVANYEEVKQNAVKVKEIAELYNSPDNIYSKIIFSLKKDEGINQAFACINNIVTDRLDETTYNHNQKANLLVASKNLVTHLEEEATKLLTEKIEN